MQQAQETLEHEQQRVAGAGRGRGIVAVEGRLGEFDEPVAEVVPGEFVQHLGEQVEAGRGELGGGFLGGGGGGGGGTLLGVGGGFGVGGFARCHSGGHWMGEGGGVARGVRL